MNKGQYESVLEARKKINKELYEELGKLLFGDGNLRFGQAVSMFFRNDTTERYTQFESMIFNEEPAITYARYKLEVTEEK